MATFVETDSRWSALPSVEWVTPRMIWIPSLSSVSYAFSVAKPHTSYTFSCLRHKS